MKAIRVHQYGPPEVLKPEELPTPVPGAGQALVKVAAVGVNFFDTQLRSGLYRFGLPEALGVEAAGTVESVGSGASAVRPGDRVAWGMVFGAYATHALVPAERLVPLPEQLDFKTAAAAFFQGITAHYLSHSTYALKPGDWCIVHAAAGGVGRLLCRMAKKRGATVIGTVSGEARAKHASEAGADHVLVYKREDFVAEVRRLTGGKGVNVVYDSLGKDTAEKSLDSLARRGLLAMYGEATGLFPPVQDIRALLQKRGSLYLTRTSIADYMATREELLERAADVFRWVADGSLPLRIDRTFPLEQAAEAHKALESGQVVGKIVLLT